MTTAHTTSIAVGDLKPGTHVHVRATEQAWQGYYVSATATTIVLSDWVRWVMGDNRPVEGKPNEDITIIIDDSVTVTVDSDDDIPVVWPEDPKIPARELVIGDVIAMGEIIKVEHRDTYVALGFKAKYGEHRTAFPPDLMVTVLSRRADPDHGSWCRVHQIHCAQCGCEISAVHAANAAALATIDPAADPAQDFSSPLLMAARGLKPGMAVIDGDGTTVHTVLSVVTEGMQTTVEYVGGVKHVVPDIEGFRVTRLSSMAVYHARQAQRAMVAELTALAEQWTRQAADDEATKDATRLMMAGVLHRVSGEVRSLLARLQ